MHQRSHYSKGPNKILLQHFYFCYRVLKKFLNDTHSPRFLDKMSFLFFDRGCSELYRMPVSEYKGSSTDSGSFEYKFPFRSNNNKWQRTSSSPQQSLTASPQPHTPNRAISLGSSVGKTLSAERLERGAVIPRSVSSDGRPLDTKRLEPLGFSHMDYWNVVFNFGVGLLLDFFSLPVKKTYFTL